MTERRFDVLVVGSGPAGSVAALVLARNGARVALVDKAGFPRDKACGDLIGPRGVQVLADLGIEVPAAQRVGDMVVVGPTGRTVRLPCHPGVTYPGHALTVPRATFDALLHEAATAAGAEPFVGRVGEAVWRGGALDGFVLSTGHRILADVIVGADGAASRVAAAAGLLDDSRALWGFALRTYVDQPVDAPHILLWDAVPRRGFPGYGWIFPGAGGQANVGLGVGVRSQRTAGTRAARELPAFLEHLARIGLLGADPGHVAGAGRLGGWLKLGMVGTVAARGRVLLVGDAAGLVNPLQGEGISQAMRSGRAAAEAVLAGPGDAAARYRRFLARAYAPYQAVTAPLHAAVIDRPRTVSTLGRVLTAPGVGRALAGGWSVFWNDLVDGARPGGARTVAWAAARVGSVVTAPSRTRHRLMADVAP